MTLPEGSPRAQVTQVIGLTRVSVDYGRPSVNKREVWGKLVPYGFTDLGFGTSKAAPWRAGANMNTTVSFQHDVVIAGHPLAAGTYGLFMALEAGGRVTVIFSKESGAWGSFYYEPAADALRVDVAWAEAPFCEQLAYEFTDVTKNAAVLALRWEAKRIPIPLTVDTDAVVVASLKRELTTSRGFYAEAWVEASGYLLENKLDLALALEWADTAVSRPFIGKRTFATLANKAAVLEALKRTDEARAVMAEALPFGTALEVHEYGRRLLKEGEAQNALAVFKANAAKFPGQWPVDYGLARGYSAIGEYPAALEAILRAQKAVPPGDSVNAKAILVNIEKLKRGENIN